MLIAILLAMVMTLIGFKMVNKVGNYENMYGVMLYGGAISTVILLVVKIILLIIVLL